MEGTSPQRSSQFRQVISSRQRPDNTDMQKAGTHPIDPIEHPNTPTTKPTALPRRLAVRNSILCLPSLVNLHRPRTSSRRLTAAAVPPKSQVTHSPAIVKHLGAATSLCWSRSPALKHFNYRARVTIQHNHQCLAPICLFLPPDRTGTRASKPASQPTWRASLRNTPRWPYT